MSTRLHIVMPDEWVAEIDAVRGDVPRSVWLRRAVAVALGGEGLVRAVRRAQAGERAPEDSGLGVSASTPVPALAEQPEALERIVPSTGESLDGARLVPERPRRAVRSHAPNCKCPVCS